MSSPATSCARRWVETASSYCSRQRTLTIVSRKLFEPICAVCHAGRGSEPMIEVGRTLSAVALYMMGPPCLDGSWLGALILRRYAMATFSRGREKVGRAEGVESEGLP